MNMQAAFKDQFAKYVDTLAAEIKGYEKEEYLWTVRQNISNSAGNLALHLIGNLNHFIGAQLGHTGYVRQRDKEFSDKNVPVKTILERLDQTRAMLIQTFEGMGEKDFARTFPLDNFGAGKTVFEVLLILIAHFNYHLGQVNYHRRLVAG